MTKTIVWLGHPEVDDSSSQQFLLSSGKALTQASYVNIQKEFASNSFDIKSEQNRLLEADRIILQFPLYWYGPPGIMKNWLDLVLENPIDNPELFAGLKNKELGLVVTADVKASHYQAGGRVGRSLSELLSPFEAIAKYFSMTYLPFFAIHQFSYMTEEEKMYLMYRYACYLETGQVDSRRAFQTYLEDKLNVLRTSQLELDQADQFIFDLWLADFISSNQEISELFQLSEEG